METKRGAVGEMAVLSRVGSLVCGVPVEHVIETMRALPVEPLVGAPSFVRGVALVRGSPVPVIDAARLLGATDAVSTGRGMFLALRAGGRTVALEVDAVVGVSALRTGTLETIPPLLADASEVISAIGTHDSSLLVVLGSARLAPASVWAAFDALHPPEARP